MIVSVRLRSTLSASTVSSLISVEISLERLLGPVPIASSAMIRVVAVAPEVVSGRVRRPPIEGRWRLISVAGSVVAVMIATSTAVVVEVSPLVLSGARALLVGLGSALVLVVSVRVVLPIWGVRAVALVYILNSY